MLGLHFCQDLLLHPVRQQVHEVGRDVIRQQVQQVSHPLGGQVVQDLAAVDLVGFSQQERRILVRQPPHERQALVTVQVDQAFGHLRRVRGDQLVPDVLGRSVRTSPEPLEVVQKLVQTAVLVVGLRHDGTLRYSGGADSRV